MRALPRGGVGGWGHTHLVLELGVQGQHLGPDLFTELFLQVLVLGPSLVLTRVRPVTEPFPLGKGYHGAGALTCSNTHTVTNTVTTNTVTKATKTQKSFLVFYNLFIT